MFAAHRAMAVSHRPERSVHFVPNPATQTLSLDHFDTSAKEILRAASNSSRGHLRSRLRSATDVILSGHPAAAGTAEQPPPSATARAPADSTPTESPRCPHRAAR